MNANNQIHALWVNGPLSALAQLTLASFLRYHGPVDLWTYDDRLQVPPGVRLRDADEIVERDRVFVYQHTVAAGSYGGFSDLFRTKLLWQHGGWWTDMDVTLLRAMPRACLDADVVLRDHWCNPVVGNLMKFPAGSEAMLATYRLINRQVDEHNRNWNKPIQLLSQTVRRMGLLRYRQTIGHRDELVDVLPFVRLPVPFPKDWWAMHWCNEMWRRGQHQLQVVHVQSAYAKLLREYGITEPQEAQS